MSMDLRKLQPGDGLSIHATYRGPKDDESFICTLTTEAGNVEFSFNYREIASHTPRPIAVGDRVKVYLGEGYVRAIVGARAWVDLVDDASEMLNGCTYGIGALERVS